MSLGPDTSCTLASSMRSTVAAAKSSSVMVTLTQAAPGRPPTRFAVAILLHLQTTCHPSSHFAISIIRVMLIGSCAFHKFVSTYPSRQRIRLLELHRACYPSRAYRASMCVDLEVMLTIILYSFKWRIVACTCWCCVSSHLLVQVFSRCAQVRDTVGLANCGISSAVAKDMHKKQGIYGTLAMA